ncbi:MAG: MATE family efflux transporter [Lachnospiraceae bacterium]|nr:MATE family efflux transporter [Lachnospiraceae bacterium]
MKRITKESPKREIDFTTGNPIRLILAFYWPLLLSSMLQQFYNFADTWIVGKGLGDNALAAVGNMGSLFFLIVGFSFGLANGFGILVAQSYGAKDTEMLRHRLTGIIELGVVLAVALSLFSVLFLPHALRLLRTDELIIDDSLRYGYIVFGGLAAGICYNIAGSVLRALGDSRTPLKAIIVSSVLNLSLDSFFIFVLHTGVEGAAIATICSQVVSCIICIDRLRKIEVIRLKKEHFHNDRSIFTTLLKNGLPMAFMNSITAIGCMVVQYFVNGFGVVYTAAYAACSKYLNLFMNPAATAGHAMSAFTSQNYGAKKYHRIREGLHVCLSIVAVSYVLLGSLMVLLPGQLASILLSGRDQIALVCSFLPKCGIMLIAVNCLFVIRSGVQGMGKPMLPMVSGILEMVLRIFAISFLIKRLGFTATAYAEVSAWTGALVLNVYAFYAALLPKLRETGKENIWSALLSVRDFSERSRSKTTKQEKFSGRERAV